MAKENSLDNQDLRKVGLKVTLPRVKILQILENAEQHHVSAEDVYKRLLELGEDVGLATVYRVLTQFEAAGLVTTHDFGGGHSVFELNQGEHHDHLVCVRCGQVKEFVDPVIEERQNFIASHAGYKITEHCLNIFGVCKECQTKD
jgi:Fur family ferric uptake transcriptional regulator